MLIAQRLDRRRNDAKILGDDRQGPERRFQHTEEFIAGTRLPGAVTRGRRVGRHGPVGLEAAKMVDADDVGQLVDAGVEAGRVEQAQADGIVLVDEDRCRGYRFCMESCPYKKIYFNAATKVSQHCIGCFPRLEQGVAPACVRQCPGRAAFVGFKDDAGSAVYKLVEKWKVALPLHAEFGTEPNVFYVPPLSPYRLREDRSGRGHTVH